MEAIGQSLVNLMGNGATWMARLFLAVLVLCLGWVISKIASKVLRQILITADFDRRLGRWLDVESMSEGQEKPKRQIAAVIEAVAYWFLLVIFVIFALEVLGDKTLSVVLQNVLSEMGLAVPHILKALLILAAAWLLAFVAKFAAIKLVRRAAETKPIGWIFTPTEGKPAGDMAVTLGNFLFYFVLLLALLPFLDALALPALVDPLKGMMSKALAYVPNLVTAAAVLVLGYFVARLCERIAGNFAQAAGFNRLVQGLRFETALKALNVPRVVGTLVFVLVLIPILATVFQILDVPVITSAFGVVLNDVAGAVPRVAGAFVLVILGLLVGRYAGDFVAQILQDVGFDVVLSRIGLEKMEPRDEEGAPAFALSSVAGNLVMAVVVLLFVMEGFRLMHLDLMADAVDRLILYVPSVLVAFLILGLGFYLARAVEGLIVRSFASDRTLEANVVGLTLRYAVVVFAFFMAFDQLGIAHSIVVTAFSILLGTIGLGFALAFGLGGTDHAKHYLTRLQEYARERRRQHEEAGKPGAE